MDVASISKLYPIKGSLGNGDLAEIADNVSAIEEVEAEGGTPRFFEGDFTTYASGVTNTPVGPSRPRFCECSASVMNKPPMIAVTTEPVRAKELCLKLNTSHL